MSSHKDICTVAEPWILLPPLYALRAEGVYAEYGHIFLFEAVEDLITSLPNGRDDYLAGVSAFARTIYAKLAAEGQRYFIDKTPRYHLIAADIIRAFPEAKFIFLWRNPLAAVASIFNTWWKGRWKLMSTHIDIYAGLSALIATHQDNKGNAISVRYEDLLTTQSEWIRIFAYLELPFDPKLLTQLDGVQISGRMGDPTGTKRYAAMSPEPLVKWRADYYNPIRIWWARRYLKWLGSERLSQMGYDMDQIQADLTQCQTSLRGLGSDLAGMVRDSLAPWVEPFIVVSKLKTLFIRKRQHVHR